MRLLPAVLFTYRPMQAQVAISPASSCFQVNSVRLRRHLNSKDFKGSIFVEFADTATADKVSISCLHLHAVTCTLWQQGPGMQQK